MKLSVELYIKKNTLVISGKANADNSSPFLTISNNITMTANQYVGHYVKVTSGDSTGLVSWILSNTTTVLTLETAIPILNADDFEIYRSDYQRLDLFKDEKISITSQIGNANDIGKLYTDYTQSFTIPASKNNNQILSHWYESSIDNGFDHRIRYDAFIEVNTHRFKDGTIQLEKADRKDGFIESYTVTFYGNLVQLKDVIKDEKLQSLDYTSFNHLYTSAEVRNRITSGSAFDIRYPLIGNANKYEYQTASLRDITTSAGAIKWNELFPAITVQNIFAKIQAKYGINFTGSFFNLKQWTELYLYLKPSLAVNFLSEPQNINFTSIDLTPPLVAFQEFNLTTDTLTTNWNFPNYGSSAYYRIRLKITPDAAYMGIPYVIYTYKDGVLFSTIEQVGTTALGVQIDLVRRQNDPTTNHTYTFKLGVSSSPFTYTANLTYQRWYNSFTFASPNNTWIAITSRANTGSITPSANINIANYIPDIKIIDFITGIIKAFNLMIIPRPNNTYEFLPLEMYYNAGKILDITEYTYEDEMSINKPKLFKSINFTYEESNNILNQAYKGLFQQNYGDLIYNSDRITENSTYDIKLPFENVLFEVPTQGKLFQTATLIDKNRSPYIPKPMLIYMNQRVSGLTGADQIYVTNSIGAATQISSYNRFSNEYDNMPTDASHSQLMTMNFGNEQSSWLNELAPQGLYFRHYRNFIDNLYNIKTRLVKVKALLPPSLLGSTVTNTFGIPLGIALNDRLVIRNKRYIINSFTTDLTSGETDLELLTDYRGVNAASTVGYRFSSMNNIQTDKDTLTFDLEIYLNDYDSFDIKAPAGFLSYTDTSDNKTDATLTVTVPTNATGLDRTDLIPIEYKLNGTTSITEYIIVTQTAI
jgi:hypothetical protein